MVSRWRSLNLPVPRVRLINSSRMRAVRACQFLHPSTFGDDVKCVPTINQAHHPSILQKLAGLRLRGVGRELPYQSLPFHSWKAQKFVS